VAAEVLAGYKYPTRRSPGYALAVTYPCQDCDYRDLSAVTVRGSSEINFLNLTKGVNQATYGHSVKVQTKETRNLKSFKYRVSHHAWIGVSNPRQKMRIRI
jgi:hypothetical protein